MKIRSWQFAALIALVGISLAFVNNAQAATETLGPFTWVKTNTICNFWGYYEIKDGTGTTAAGDIVAAFVEDVVSGTPDGCIGAYQIEASNVQSDTSGMYGMLPAYADDATTGGVKDGAADGDTVYFKYYSASSGTVFDVPGAGLANIVGTFTGGSSVQVDLKDDPDDISLPVVLSSFTATSADQGVVVSWCTETELNNSGFDIYRSDERTGKFVKITQEIIKGAGISAEPHDYNFLDEAVEPGHTYYYYLKSIDFSGDEQQTHVIRVTIDFDGVLNVDSMLGTPAKSMLLQNFPNPFNPETWIPFQLTKTADVTIRIYNIKGEAIRVLDVGHKDAGYHVSKGSAVYWDGRDNSGELSSSGIYFYAISAGDFHAVKKLIIMK